jgi:hypothetical protein
MPIARALILCALLLAWAVRFGASTALAQQAADQVIADKVILLAARPNPYNRGNCFQWKRCLGETIGNMWIEDPQYCAPLGGKSWKSEEGKCINLMEPPWLVTPQAIGQPE